MLSCEDVYKGLDAISRERALSHEESMALERAIKAIDSGRTARETTWNPEDDAMLIRLRREGKSFAQAATSMGRTKSACRSRWRRIGG